MEPTLEPVSFGPLGSIVLKLPVQKRRNSQDGDRPRVSSGRGSKRNLLLPPTTTTDARPNSFRRLAPSRKDLPRKDFPRWSSLSRIDTMSSTPASSRESSPAPKPNNKQHNHNSNPELNDRDKSNSAPRIAALKEEMKNTKRLRRKSSSRRRRDKRTSTDESGAANNEHGCEEFIIVKRKRTKITSDRKSRKGGSNNRPPTHHQQQPQQVNDTSASSMDQSPQCKRKKLKGQRSRSMREVTRNKHRLEHEEDMYFVRHQSKRRPLPKHEDSNDAHVSTSKRRSRSSSNSRKTKRHGHTSKHTKSGKNDDRQEFKQQEEEEQNAYEKRQSLENFLQKKHELIKKLEAEQDGDTWIVSVQPSRGGGSGGGVSSIEQVEDDDVISLTIDDLYDHDFEEFDDHDDDATASDIDEGDISIACSYMIA